MKHNRRIDPATVSITQMMPVPNARNTTNHKQKHHCAADAAAEKLPTPSADAWCSQGDS